jgi:glucokinase
MMTNHAWELSVAETRQMLRLDSLKVLNNFTSLALALPYLGKDDFYQVGRETANHKQTIAVLGPGTGLGVTSISH